MSAPPLPDAFGNYALGDFVEVVSPAAVSWLPQTVAWRWLAAVLAAYLLYRAWLWLRHWYRNRYRREAAAQLAQLAERSQPASLVAAVNQLLKRAALAAYSREQVASLSGADWVNFLNRHCADSPFSPEQARLLAVGTYTRQSIDPAAGRQLVAASRRWLFEHENAFGD